MKKIKYSKKFIYLISPSKIKDLSFHEIERSFKTNKVSFFQLRLKNTSKKKIFIVGKKIKKICDKYKIKFIINDDPFLTKKLNADGCHLGQKDMNVSKAKKIIKNKIIGLTCHNSKKLIQNAINYKVSYIAIGSFFSSKTKKIKYKAKIDLLNYAKNITKIPIVVIGGINSNNYKKLMLNKANFLAISGYIWKNNKYKPHEAIKILK